MLLLPTQNSVPHLRTRLQLQQAIMKELLQRQAQEKLQKKLQDQNQTKSLAVSTVPVSNSTVHGVTTVLGQALPQQPGVVEILGPASEMSKGEQLPNQHHNQQINTNNIVTTHPASSSSASSATASSVQPISATQLRERLALMTPQQKLFYMQQLQKHGQAQSQQQRQRQQPQNTASSSQPTASQTVSPSVQLQGSKGSSSNSTTSVQSLPAMAVSVVPSVQQVAERQQRLVEEQQQQIALSVMNTAAKSSSSVPKLLPASSSPASLLGGNLNQVGRNAISGATSSPSRGTPAQSRTNFADLKVVSGASHSTPPSQGKGKARVKNETGKATAEE